MLHRGRLWRWILAAALIWVFPCGAAARSGIDMSRVRGAAAVYPVTLTIGDMPFHGTLSRMDKVTDDEVEKAIQQALKELGLTELEVAEAQEAVERGVRADTLTREDVDRVMGNLMKLAGVDTVVDLIKAVKYNVSGTMEYTCQNEEALNWIYNTSNSMTVQGKTVSGNVDSASQRELDPSLWERWDREKWLEIQHP